MKELPFTLSIAVGLLAFLLAALEIGFRRGRHARRMNDAASSAELGAVQGAILGLLGLLLAFSFAAAGGRFLERQDMIVAEANTIGTAWLRADLLDEPQRSELRAALEDYTRHRIEFGRTGADMDDAARAELARLHERIWKISVAGVTARPAATLAVLNPVNELMGIQSIRAHAVLKHLPFLVLMLLIACSGLALGVIGYSSGVGGNRHPLMTVSLAFVIGVALWITIDLDYPRRGVMQLSDAPLEALHFDAP